MARKPRWQKTRIQEGSNTVTLSSWKYFPDFINQQLLDYRTYIFRGQSSDDWQLESSLDRLLRAAGRLTSSTARASHLRAFQYAVRGRRGPNPPTLKEENEWWALGQHHGLKTPLLDWTESPFVAAYFAFEDVSPVRSEYRVIWALSQHSTVRRSAELRSRYSGAARPPVVEILRPHSDENSRLVNQRGLFTRGPDAVPIDDWVKRHFAAITDSVKLMKIRVPSKDRELALRMLNRMNINHLSLFPDLYGASKYCNYELTIEKY